MSMDFLFNHHIVPAFVPVADAFAGGITTEAVSMANYRRVTLVIMTGAREDTGISNLVTIEGCTTAAGGTTAAVAFSWRAQRYSTTVDTWSDLTAATSSGYNFASNNTAANVLWFAEVDVADVIGALPNAQFIRASIAETANKTITAAGLWILSEPRYPQSIPVQAIA